MALKSKLRNNIYLIGTETNQILGSKLPSNRQVLQVLFYNIRCVKMTLRESARLVISETIIFWQKARIPYRDLQHCIAKLEILYNEWRSLQKHAGRKTETQKNKEDAFNEKLDDLFDIAHANAMNMIKIEEDRLFLIAQREKGRVGVLGRVDKRTAEREERVLKRICAERVRQNKSKEMEIEEKIDVKSLSPDSLSHGSSSEDEMTVIQCSPGPSQVIKRGKISFINTKLVAALDKCKISDRDAVHILIATAEALGHTIDDLVLNRSSIRRCRQKLRAERASVLRSEFQTLKLPIVVVHWDGKMLPAITGIEKVDRLPVIVSANEKEHLLGAPQLASSRGEDMAEAIYNLLEENQLLDLVVALCCDTTASNTGRIKGACILLEQKLKKDLLYLPCRHHIYELVLKAAFEVCIATSSGPEAGLFKRFQQAWPYVNINKYATAMEDQFVMDGIGTDYQVILQFAIDQLNIQQARDDYREFLELVVIFLGGRESKDVRFRQPGAFHHARWMAKAIYCLKILIFKNEFKLTRQELTGLKDICIFIIKLYLKAWYNAPSASKAPFQDLQFLNDLYSYRTVNRQISQATTKKMCGHLWYLTDETVALAFFDDSISVELKCKMAKALKERESAYSEYKRLLIQPEDIPEYANKELHHIVSKNTSKFFERFKLSFDFIHHDPANWQSQDDFKQGLAFVQNLKVVNDTAERGIKLMEEYNSLITKNEEQKQYLLQVVRDYRNHFPSCSKDILSKKY